MLIRTLFIFILVLANYELAWAPPPNWNDYNIPCILTSRLKSTSTLDLVEVLSPNESKGTCYIEVTPTSFKNYNFKQKIYYFFTGNSPTLSGTGTITDNGIITVAHLFLQRNKISFLRRENFFIYKPIKIEQGVTLNCSGEKKCHAEWEEKENENIQVKISDKLVTKRSFFGNVQAANFKGYDVALISGTGLQDFSVPVTTNIDLDKEKRNYVEAKCFHYPLEYLPQKYSEGVISLHSKCSESPLSHHDIFSTHGSSGAGIQCKKEDRIVAVLCSGPDCEKDFPHLKYNHCIPIDDTTIMDLKHDLLQEDNMRFSSLAYIMMTLWSENALASFDIKDDFPGPNHSKGVFRHEGIAPGGLIRGSYIPHNPEPMWRRARVFAPNIRMVKLPLVVSTIPAYFWVKSHFAK